MSLELRWNVTFDQAKARFFDRAGVLAASDRATMAALARFGAYTMRRARTSIRMRGPGKVSEPGNPPFGHDDGGGRSRLRYGILFWADPHWKSVIIGPEKLNVVYFNGAGQPTRGTVPRVLEEGGTIQVLEWFRAGRWSRADLRSRRRMAQHPTRLRPVQVRARPYMGPAFHAELEASGDKLWFDSLRHYRPATPGRAAA